jgi:hypothetical protein
LLPRPNTPARSRPVPAGAENYNGSFMVYVMDRYDDVWDRLKEDIYWKSGVWDTEKIIVEELIG